MRQSKPFLQIASTFSADVPWNRWRSIAGRPLFAAAICLRFLQRTMGMRFHWCGQGLRHSVFTPPPPRPFSQEGLLGFLRTPEQGNSLRPIPEVLAQSSWVISSVQPESNAFPNEVMVLQNENNQQLMLRKDHFCKARIWTLPLAKRVLHQKYLPERGFYTCKHQTKLPERRVLYLHQIELPENRVLHSLYVFDGRSRFFHCSVKHLRNLLVFI